MRRRWVWLLLAVIVLLVGVAAARFSDVVRLTAIATIRLATGRPVSIDALTFDPFSGKLAVRGFRLEDRDGSALGEIERLDARIHVRSLLRGRVWIRDLAIVNSTVRVVRLSNGDFNLSDMIPRGEKRGPSYDVTVDHFSLRGGTVILEDRVLTPWRTWHSRDITIEARDVSSSGRGGVAEGSSILEGAPVALRIDDLQLVPIHLRGRITARGMDLGLVRLYVPASAPLTPERGRLDATIDLVHDARDGTRVNLDASAADLVAVRPYRPDPAVVAPALTIQVRDLGISPQGAIGLAHVALTGHGTVIDSDVSPPARFDLARVRLAADDVTWPVQRPARVALAASLKTGGELTVDGTARTQPNAADLDVRLTGLVLEPWARYVPGPTRLTGVADAAFAVHADFDPARRSARARGRAGIQRVILTQGDRRLVSAERAEVLGVDLAWPLRIAIERVRIRRPSAAVARDVDGEIDLRRVFGATAAGEVRDGGRRAPSKWNGQVQIGEVVVEGGTLSWADAAVTPASRFTVSNIDVTVRDVTWPLRESLAVQLRAAAPGGGRVEVGGRVGLDPINADVRVVAKGVELAPYAGYVPIRGRLTGRTDLDLAVVVPSNLARTPLVARGRAGLSRATVFDGMRAILAVDRADVAGLDVEWPAHVTVDSLRLIRPWALVERDAKGGFPLQPLLTPRQVSGGDEVKPAEAKAPAAEDAPAPTVVTVGRAVVEGGAARVVDHTVTPTYVEEVWRLSLRATGFGTAAEQPGRVDLSARLGPRGTLTVRGAVRPSPLLVDLQGDLRDVGVPSLNSYVERFTGWRANNGRISMKASYRVQDDRLDARNEIALSRLDVVRATATDAAQQRVGLPLGMLVSLMKDSRGDIRLVLPMGGSLSDPRFDLHEIIWGAVRRISIKAVTLPVSWIGRLRVGRDGKIQDVTIDPVPFQPGRPVLTAEGDAQLGRLVAFMQRLPDTKMVVTPVVSLGDVDELKREEVRREIARRAAADGRPPNEAAARLFAEHFPRDRVPATVEAIVDAVSRDDEPPDAAAVRLAKERVNVTKAALKKAGIDIARLEIHTDAEAVETSGGGQVDFILTEQVRQKRHRLAELLAKLREVFQSAMHRMGNEHPAASPRTTPLR